MHEPVFKGLLFFFVVFNTLPLKSAWDRNRSIGYLFEFIDNFFKRIFFQYKTDKVHLIFGTVVTVRNIVLNSKLHIKWEGFKLA